MGLAEDIAGKVKGETKEGGAEDTTVVEAVKKGDRGKAILAAISQNDHDAVEELLGLGD